jgi:glycosyltransferase involved in cell wall biosynthesis
VKELEGRIESDRDQLAAAMAELKEGRSADRDRLREQHRLRRERSAEHRRRLTTLEDEQEAILDSIERVVPEIESGLEHAEDAVTLKGHADQEPPLPSRRAASLEPDDFERWRERATAAPGDEVVFMYSGTIFVQEKRGNRPIRLTRVYLDHERPVFFNYWRWKAEEPGPEWGHPLLHQSPVDVTPKLLDRLLEADFGDKRKVMFASFPHELMIRALSRAAQHGWVTIYDARDDWEEFEKVGMAKWYDPGFEEYLVRHADVVTAVSEPLARKLAEMGDRPEITVVPNALDSKFPRPDGPREPSTPPTVGYFGHLTPKWFDWDLVIRAARQHPDWRFELAGHQHPEDLELPENVSLLGLLGHSELATLSRRWSFALIPFKVSALGEAVDPIKVYEYLHLGLPVLSSYMPQMRDYPATTIAESAEDFLALLPEMAERTVDTARTAPWLEENTWEVRVETFSRLAAEAEARHGAGRDLRSLLAYPYEQGRNQVAGRR